MLNLKLLEYADELSIQVRGGLRRVWDPVRKRWVALLPEEFVRQLTLAYLIREKAYPVSGIAVEKIIKGHHLKKRCDILAYSHTAAPWLLVECKAPEVQVDLEVFLQAANYNLALKVPYLMMTNGRQTLCCHLDYQSGTIREASEIPGYFP